jgi:hypothetical protein
MIGEDLEKEEEEGDAEGKPISWKSIAIDIAQSVQSLHKAIVAGDNPVTFKQKITSVVDAVRLMLYSSRSMDKDAPHLQDAEVKEPHRNVLASLAKLILSAKALNESNMNHNNGKVQRDAADVLNAVRKFVLVCQNKNVPIRPVNPRLLFNTVDNNISNNGTQQQEYLEDTEEEGKRKSNNSPAITKAKYPLNQDLIVSLQTHAKQIVGSTDALCKASSYIYQVNQYQIKKENEQVDTEKKEESDEEEITDEKRYILEERAKSNVILLFQNLSSQIGNYLAILNDIDISHIDPSQLQSLPSFRNNKQRLYNSVGLLFSAVQTLTNSQLDLMTSINRIEETVGMVENAIEEIFSNVVQMVGERKIWMMRNGEHAGAIVPAEPNSPVSSYFDIDRKQRPSRGSLTTDDESSEATTPIITRFYNRQNSQGTVSSHRPSISQSTSSLTRPSPGSQSMANSKALKRQFSFGHGNTHDEMSQLWFLQYDYAEGDIVFSADKSVKGGTIRALVERLTLHDEIGKLNKVLYA